MKYFVSLISLLIVFATLLFFEGPIILFFNILIISIFYLILFYWEFSVFDRKIESSFKLKSQMKSMNFYQFAFGIQGSIIVIRLSFDTSTKIVLLLFIWMAIVIDLIMCFLYKKKKPYTLFVRKNELVYIGKWIEKRDLTGLNRILFDRINKKFEVRFDKGYKLKINSREYKKEDIDKLLEIFIEKSKHSISIPNNYKE